MWRVHMSVTCLSHACHIQSHTSPLLVTCCHTSVTCLSCVIHMLVTCTQALDSALEDENKKLFFEVASACKTVICCR